MDETQNNKSMRCRAAKIGLTLKFMFKTFDRGFFPVSKTIHFDLVGELNKIKHIFFRMNEERKKNKKLSRLITEFVSSERRQNKNR